MQGTGLHPETAEMAVLGIVILDNDCFESIAAVVDHSDFFETRNATIWQQCSKLRHAGEAIDFLTLEDAGCDADYLSKCVDSVPSVKAHESYARIVRRASLRRQLHDACVTCSSSLVEGRTLEDVSSILLPVIHKCTSAGIQAPVDLVANTVSKVELYQQGRAQGLLRLGPSILDQYSPGPGDLVVIGARPSIGKTAFALNISEWLSARDIPGIFLSVEMSCQAITQRRLAIEGCINSWRLKVEGGLTTDEWMRLAEAANVIDKKPLHILDSVNTVPQIEAAIRRYRSAHGIQFAVIDYLQLIDFGEGKESRNVTVGAACTRLKHIFRELDIAGFLLSQLKRPYEPNNRSKQAREPELSDLRDSGTIEQDADRVYLLHCNGQYGAVDGESTFAPIDDSLIVKIAKNRDGPVGRIRLHFDRPTGRIGSN